METNQLLSQMGKDVTANSLKLPQLQSVLKRIKSRVSTEMMPIYSTVVGEQHEDEARQGRGMELYMQMKAIEPQFEEAYLVFEAVLVKKKDDED